MRQLNFCLPYYRLAGLRINGPSCKLHVKYFTRAFTRASKHLVNNNYQFLPSPFPVNSLYFKVLCRFGLKSYQYNHDDPMIRSVQDRQLYFSLSTIPSSPWLILYMGALRRFSDHYVVLLPNLRANIQ